MGEELVRLVEGRMSAGAALVSEEMRSIGGAEAGIDYAEVLEVELVATRSLGGLES